MSEKSVGKKHCHRVVTLEKKLEIISQLKKVKSQRFVSSLFDIPKSTVADVWKARDKIERHVSASDNPSFAKKRCIVKEANLRSWTKQFYTWFIQQRSKGAPVPGPLLQQKALQMFKILYPDKDADSFKGNSGWLHKFSCRHRVRGISLQGESLSADASAVFTFRSKQLRKMEEEGYTQNQVFNADETGLWWRLLPSRALIHCGEREAKNFKKSKERVTLLACSNAAGTCRLPLTFIHTSAKPRCFKHMDMNSLPVHYYSQKKAWMDSTLFESWFHDRFMPYAKKLSRQ